MVTKVASRCKVGMKGTSRCSWQCEEGKQVQVGMKGVRGSEGLRLLTLVSITSQKN